MTITIVAAVARDGVIGKGGRLPWRYSEDLKHFSAVTCGSTVAMGRLTWESLPPGFKPLPGRKNVVLSRGGGARVPERLDGFSDPNDLSQPSVWVDAERYIRRMWYLDRDVCVIGGSAIYEVALPHAHRLVLTEVDICVPGGDAFFPRHAEFWGQPEGTVAVGFRLAERRKGETLGLTFTTWERS